MSLYAVKNDEGKWWDFNDDDGFWPTGECRRLIADGKEEATNVAKNRGGRVVELVEAPAKAVVSEEEASLLEKMADGTNFNGERGFEPGLVITNFVLNNRVHGESHFETEDRLMHAYTNGWTVEKPKRYVMPMPYGADDDDPDHSHYAVVNREYHAGPAWHQGPCVSFKKAREHYTVTQSDIDAAPDWVKAITPMDVTDDEQ